MRYVAATLYAAAVGVNTAGVQNALFTALVVGGGTVALLFAVEGIVRHALREKGR